ncbi:phosphatase PAP2 family protein [Streptomyces sp. NPDC060028]|uniref:phosphatase PAP2 family protein n=1 Tax=Streptomyces sp. NPDC060028 TaxID=3347041 RepID=UPI0036B7E989
MTRSRSAARTAGWLAAVAAALFALLAAWVIRSPGRPLPGDTGLTHWSREHRPAAAAVLARLITDTGTGVIPYALLLLAGLLAGHTARQRVTTAVGLALCLAAGQAVRWYVMWLIARPRPAVADWATHASRWSFPSGHTSTATMTAGLLIAALFLRGSRVPRTAVVLVAAWCAAVGLTRVYLGVHWFSDVLGGWLFATAWLSLVTCGYLTLTGRNGRLPS